LAKSRNFRLPILKVIGAGSEESKLKLFQSGLKFTKDMQHREMLYTIYGHRKCIGIFGLSPSAARDKEVGHTGDFIKKMMHF